MIILIVIWTNKNINITICKNKNSSGTISITYVGIWFSYLITEKFLHLIKYYVVIKIKKCSTKGRNGK